MRMYRSTDKPCILSLRHCQIPFLPFTRANLRALWSNNIVGRDCAMLSVASRHTKMVVRSAVKFLSTVVKPPAFLTAPNGERVPYPIGIKEPIQFPILYVGTDALKEYLPENVRGAELINKAQEIYAHALRPHLMLWARGSWVACSSNAELFMARTQEEVGELAERYFQPADGSVDCFVCCVGSEFAEVVCMGDMIEVHCDDQHVTSTPTADKCLPVDLSPNGSETLTSVDMNTGAAPT